MLARYYARQWKLVTAIMVICLGIGTLYFLMARPLYRAQVTVQYQSLSQQNEALNSPLGLGLALVGLQGDRTAPERAKAFGVMRSKAFLSPFIQEMNLAPELFPRRFNVRGTLRANGRAPTESELHEAFLRRVLSIDDNTTTGLVTLSVYLSSAERASSVANKLVLDLNSRLRSDAVSQAEQNIEYLNRQLTTTQITEMRTALAQLVQTEMRRLLLASGRTTFVFHVIDPATVPDRPYAPRPVLVAALAVLAGFMLGLGAVLARFLVASPRR